MHRLRALVDSDGFRSFILFLILLNALAMAIEATPILAASYGPAAAWLLDISLLIFVLEIGARWLVCVPRRSFFRESWNRFDFLIVVLSLLPAVGSFALAARTLRVFRVLRVVSAADVLWGSMLRQESGVRALAFTSMLIAVLVYVFALAGYHLFGELQAQWASLGQSLASIAASLTPSGVGAVMQTRSPAVIAFHAAFYVALASAAANLAISMRRRAGANAA